MAKFPYRDNMNIQKIDGFTLQLVAKNVWAIDEFGMDIMYLILGKEKALLLDTGLGIGDIGAVVKELTQLPVYVVNSHHHYDHVGGNGKFRKVYAHKKAIPVIKEQNNLKYRKAFLLSQEKRTEYNHEASVRAHLDEICDYEIEGIEEGDIFELGERELEVLFTPGHTKDSICLLDRKNKLLFSADTIVSTPILILDSFSDTMNRYLISLQKLREYKEQYELIFPGHYIRPIGGKYVEDMIQCITEILHNPLIGTKDKCTMAEGQVYFFQYNEASVLYTLDRVSQIKV